jgi:hypothetical protein
LKKTGFSVRNVKEGLLRNVRVSKMICYMCDLTLNEMNQQHDLYKIESHVECGQDRPSSATRHPEEMTNKTIIATFLFPMYSFYTQLAFVLFPYCVTLLIQTFFCSFTRHVQ